ncbi:hypothetical protein LL912_24470 [Niabella sp. CC-SYL272]|uniref:hypothetical protein n=1 Tax=Niabella agricola TaxID=2891571 RepID=UPI001F17C8DC|nr:hypothetical protein [Niabella agricola]MCF3111966.1 hypothetical protein [Niabella agricola]
MKQLSFFILPLLFSFPVAGQDLSEIIYPDKFRNSKSDLAKNNIAMETIYEYNSQKKKLDSTKACTITYDKEGNILNKQDFYNNMLSVNERYVYTADKKLHQIIIDSYPSEDQRIFEYEYDSLGNEVKEYIYNRDTTSLVTNVKLYNSKNQISRYYTKKGYDSFRLEKIYYYNEADILTKIEIYQSMPQVKSIFSYIVNTNNNYEIAYHQELSNNKRKEEFIFDGSNRCIRLNGYAIQPIVYINEIGVSKREIKIIPRTQEFEYNIDGTLFRMTEKVGKKTTTLRKHFYTKH